MRETSLIKSMWGLFSFLFTVGVHGQEFQFEPEGIPVEIDGLSVNSPFLGSFGSRSFEFADIDADGDLDFFSAAYNSPVRFFRNIGTSSNLRLRFEPGRFSDIVISTHDFGFADIDDDGDFDLFVLQANNIAFYLNQGTPTDPIFVLQGDSLLPNELMAVAFSFSDINHDGDVDLFVGNSNGTLTFFENDGSPAHPLFSKKEGLVDAIRLEYAAIPVLADIDNDRDFDLFVGVYKFGLFSGGEIRFFRNVGNQETPAFALERVDFVSRHLLSDVPYHVFADTDDDGFLELLVNNLSGGISYYLNGGSAQPEDYSLKTSAFISLDGGQDSSPALADIDKDGDLDLFKMETARTSLIEGRIDFYRNEGGRQNPMYTKHSISLPMWISIAYGLAASFADIDNDGDLDFVLGESSGYVSLHRNISSNMATPQFVLDSLLTKVSSLTKPALVDIDADKDLDLFVGTGEGQLHFYRNLGNSSEYDFQLETDNYLGKLIAHAAPCFFDIDKDNDFDLFLGNGEGTIHFYRNSGSAQHPDFLLETESYGAIDVGAESTPCWGDIDGDGDADLFVGNNQGGISFFRNQSNPISTPAPRILPAHFMLHQNYPNPFTASTSIQYELPRASLVKLTVFNLLGQQVASLVTKVQAHGVYRAIWDGKDSFGQDVANGIYLYKLETNDFVEIKKLILSR